MNAPFTRRFWKGSKELFVGWGTSVWMIDPDVLNEQETLDVSVGAHRLDDVLVL